MKFNKIKDVLSTWRKCGTKETANGSTEKLQEWPDFWGWLSNEVKRLSNLFDSEGKEYDLNTPTVPN